MLVLRNGSTGYVKLAELWDTINAIYPQAATVTYTLYDASATPVTNATAVTMPQVSGTSGRSTVYRGEVPSTVALPVAQEGSCTVTATYLTKVRKFTEAVTFE